MASKRRVAMLNSFSLYDDLEAESSRSEENRKKEEQGEGDEGPTNKRAKEEQNDVSLAKRSNDGVDGVNVLSVCGWRKGEREEMQDAHVLDDHFQLSTVVDIKTSAFYAIFDGHAGRRAAQFAAERLPSVLKTRFSSCKTVAELESGLKKSFVDGYRQVDEQFLAQARKVDIRLPRGPPMYKHTNTIITVIVICVGGSIRLALEVLLQAVVCRKKSSDTVIALQLTVDHSPLQFDERMRIQKAGGTVRDGRIMGVLEVSRSIGDGQFKAHGVTCIPDVKKFSITPEDRFILIACDGLWKTFSNQEAVEYVLEKTEETVKVEKTSEEETLIDSRYSIWERTAGELAAESVRRGCGDNVSVIIVVLNDTHA